MLTTQTLHLLEACSLLMSTMIVFTYYNPIGELAGKSGRDYASVIDGLTFDLDRAIPLVPGFVFAYIIVYLMPLALTVLALRRSVSDETTGLLRAFFATQMLMMVAAFACFVAFPVKFDLLVNRQGEQIVDTSSTWLHRLNYAFVHQGISKYVACPSMHCAHAFSCAFVWAAQRLPGQKLVGGLALLTLASTVFTKAHGPPHLALGVGLAVLFHRAVYARLVASKALHPILDAKHSPTARLALIALAPVGFLLVGEELSRLSGWHTDIPGMFGAEPAAEPGLYGLRADMPYLAVRGAMNAVYGCYLQPAAFLAH